MPIANPTQYWTAAAQKALLNRRIVAVRYMTDQEAAEFGWYCKPVVLELDDSSLWWPSCDDEGNNGGAMFSTNPTADCLPVLHSEAA